MPQQFTGTVDTPRDLQFGADEYVDSSNSLEGLTEGAKALAATTGYMVQKKLQSDLLAEDANVQAKESELRRLKQQWYQAAEARDEEQLAQFGKQIEELTIAERQGAINGTNASIRKESLLRSYINRFPHREEELRQVYSATRRALQEARAERVSDPFEEAYDDIIKESVARGKTPIQVLEDRQKADANQRTLQDLQVKAALGADIAPQIEQNFDQNVLPRLHNIMFGVIDEEYQKVVLGQGDVDVMNVKRKLEAIRQNARYQVSKTLNDLVAQTEEPGAVLPLEVRNAQIAKVDNMFNSMMPYLENIDTLKQMGRNLEHLKHKTMDELMQVDPMLRMLISIGAVDWAGKFLAEDYPQVANMAATMGPAGLQAFIDNAPTAMERNRRKFQARMLGLDYSPEERAADLKGVVETGSPPAQTGDPYVDAGRLIQNTDPIIKSKHTPPEAKRNAGVAILEAEKRETTYLAPGAHWYKDRDKLELLRSSPELMARMEDELAGSAATMTRKISEHPEIAESLTFAPQLESETDHRQPWRAYPSGGPFTIVRWEENPANVDFQQVSQLPVFGPMVRDRQVILDTLNNMYWLVRGMKGPAAAEDWAMEVLAQRDADMQAKTEEAQAAKARETAPFDLPILDVDLTD